MPDLQPTELERVMAEAQTLLETGKPDLATYCLFRALQIVAFEQSRPRERVRVQA